MRWRVTRRAGGRRASDGSEAEDQACGLNETREGASSATHQSPDIRGSVTVGPGLTRSGHLSRVSVANLQDAIRRYIREHNRTKDTVSARAPSIQKSNGAQA